MPRLRFAVLSVTVLMLVAACGGGSETASGGAPSEEGEPIAGGTAQVLQHAEPQSLDPAALSNTWAHMATLGNALYGTLITNDSATLDTQYKMATGFVTTDGGKTFDLTLRPGLMFTDGTPLDAAAVKVNWDRLKDPSLGSNSTRYAVLVANTEVVLPDVMRATLVSPNPQFAETVVASSMNWIASPTALEKGVQSYSDSPVGAGPFKLTRWTRQGEIELEKNPGYWDAPKPYLDSLTIRTVHDASQRLNAVATGGADLASESSMNTINQADAQGLGYEVVPTGGGQIIAMNHQRRPFDDVRARRAVQMALDTEILNTIVFSGQNEVPQTLFNEESAYYRDIPLQNANREEAQRLFNELAAEGKPIVATFMAYPTSDSRMLAEAVQAQLSAYENIEVKVDVRDIVGATRATMTGDFDLTISAAIVQGPDFALWTAFHSTSTGNQMGVSDPELDAALDKGRTATTDAERLEAYTEVQNRINAVIPGVWYTRAAPAVIYGKNVRGVEMYTLGSPLPEDLWVNNG
ncbi:ABC transporter substrate-binding protein [Rhodococcus sp. KBS0724]|uniref:ABC transporter substrate-binding protein n=1 Tax=Rhodococcus sp. KBS0724 TaxID=1179674 RepID=UPI0021B13857|nr:ABC transporter substrate-binding protein [Rhodococcus sp. KBS0724]